MNIVLLIRINPIFSRLLKEAKNLKKSVDSVSMLCWDWNSNKCIVEDLRRE